MGTNKSGTVEKCVREKKSRNRFSNIFGDSFRADTKSRFFSAMRQM